MGNYTATSKIDLTINARQARDMLDKVKKDTANLEKQLKAAEKAGDKISMKKLHKQISENQKLMKIFTTEAQQAADVLARLDKASPKELNKTLKQLKSQLNNIERGSEAWNAHIAKIKAVKNEIASLNDEMNPDASMWDKLNGYWEKFQLGIVGAVGVLTGFVVAGKKAVQAYAEMEQEMANVRKFTGMSAEEVESLNEHLKKIDTRTPREELNKLAQEAGRLGKSSEEDVLGFVRAADKINVALDDLGEGATLTLSKLTGIFGDEERLGTEKALLSVGSVINELSQNCSASAPYLAQFASRMGGVGAQAGLTVQQIMAFGAVLDSNNQALEASATAVSQVMVRIYQEPAKYARVAGMDVKKFSELVKSDMNAAFIELLENLSKAGKMDVLSPMFKDMGENGSRAISALSTLASHIDDVKRQQIEANKAFEEAVSIDKEFEVQNTTVQASLDKAKNRVNELAVELGEKLQPVMRLFLSSSTIALETLSKIVSFFMKYKTEILAVAVAIGVYNVAVNLATIKTTLLAVRVAAVNKLYALTAGLGKTLSLVYAGLHNAVSYFTNGLSVNYEMQKRWNSAMSAMKKANWAGIIITIATAVLLIAKNWKKARDEQEKTREALRKIEKEAMEQAAAEIQQLDALYRKTQDVNLSQEERIKAITALRNMYPAYFKDISNEAFLAGKAADAYNRLKTSILDAAKAKGREAAIGQYEKEALELEDSYDKEAEYWVTEKMKIRARSMQGGMNPEDDPSYKLAEHNLKILEDKYKKPAEALRARQDKLAALNADYKTENPEENTTPESPSYTGYTKTETEKERKKRLAEEAKAARAAAAKDKKEFKDALKKARGNRDEAEAEAKMARMAGLIDYREYMEALRKAEEDFYNASEKVYIDHNLTEDADYKALIEKKIDAEKKWNEKRIALNKEAIERIATVEEREIRARYATKQQMSLADELALQEELLTLNYNKLMDLQQLYDKDSKEWADYQIRIDDLIANDVLEKRKKLLSKAAEFQKQFDSLSVKQKYDLERKAVETLYQYKMITEEQYRKWLEKLNKNESRDSKAQKDNLPGSAKNPFASAEQAKAEYEAKKDQLDEALKSGMISMDEYSARLVRIKKEYREALLNPLKESKSEWVSLMTSMVDAWMSFADALKTGEKGDIFSSISAGISATAALMSAVMQQVTEFTKAQAQIQINAMEKRYDRELALAEGNSYLSKKLEKEKQEEIAKIKEEESKKAFAMQIIATVAQTAANAVAAYGSAAAIPVVGHVLAPIAAALAVAQGVAQVAVMKKQQQAAAATGYSEGGFTRPGRKDDPAGVVHAGEWVASQKLVNNPRTRPIIDMLEQAQRSNRIGSITMEDVSRSVSAPARLAMASAEPVPQQIYVGSADGGAPSQPASQLPEAITRLVQRLDEPFITHNTVAGKFGYRHAEEEFDRMMRNKSRKVRS